MSKKEKTVSNLFEQARTEELETNIYDVQNWIGMFTLNALLIGLLAKTKKLFTKTTIMFTTTLLTIGIVLGTFFFNETKSYPEPIQSEIQQQDEIIQENLLADEPNTSPELNDKMVSKAIISADEVEENHTKPLEKERLQELKKEDVEVEEIAYVTKNSLPTSFIKREIVQNDPIANEQNYGAFDGIRISNAITAVILQGDQESVRIEGEQNGSHQIVVKNNSGTLELSTELINGKKAKSIYSNKNAVSNQVVYITVKNLKRLNCTGAVKVSSNRQLNFEDLELKASGASKLNLNLRLNQLDLNTSGASSIQLGLQLNQIIITTSGACDIDLEGKANSLALNASGASNIDALNFMVENAKIDASGASDIALSIAKEIDLNISGASKLFYKGSPIFINNKISGASKVEKLK